jgi:phosphomannomutase
MSKLMVSVSGIRGIFGETFTPEIAMNYAAHFGMFCGKGTIVVGRDSRTTGEAIYHAIVSGLVSVGCDVLNIGIASTPTVLLTVEESDAVGGIAITASHNPAQWNALKLVSKAGMFLFPEDAQAFFKTLDAPIQFADWQEMGHISEDFDAGMRHLQKVLAIPYLDLEKIRSRRFRVVLDSVNGAGGVISPTLLLELGCELIELNSEPNGHFAHIPEPLNQNLNQLEVAVQQHLADVGFATDPDVDRLALVSEKGHCIGEEMTILLAEKFILPYRKGDIVVNLSSSMASEDIAAEFGVHVHRTKVGEINVGKAMQELNSPVGGEGNGGVICPEVHYTRDALAGMALILGLMAREEKPLSEIVATIPQYYFAKGKMEIPVAKLDLAMQKAEELFSTLEQDKRDGLKILGDKYWIHIRKSGTEPIIRVYVESETQAKSDTICDETMNSILKEIQ